MGLQTGFIWLRNYLLASRLQHLLRDLTAIEVTEVVSTMQIEDKACC
jgi:hypothetical protein